MYPSSRSEQIGVVAGTASALLWAAIVVTRTSALLGNGPDPSTLLRGTDSIGGVVVVATLFVGFVAGLAQSRYADGVEWANLARAIYYGPVAVFGVVLVLVVGANVLGVLAAGSVGGALVAGILALAVGLVVGSILGLVLAAVVAVPAVVGVYAGVRVGRASHDGDASERDSPWTRDGSRAAGGRHRPTGWTGRLAALVPWVGERRARSVPERYGWWAGVAGTVATLVVQIGAPWGVLVVDFSRAAPVGTRPGSGTSILAGAVFTAVLGAVAVRRYQAAVERPPSGYRRKMAWQAALAPLVVGMVASFLVLIVDGLVVVLSGTVGEALLGVIAGVFGGIFFGPIAGVLASVVVGVPTAAGVLLGSAGRPAAAAS
jgi:hypothetical protein